MLPSGFLAWMNKKNPDAAFTDDEDLEAFFNDEEDGGELLDYYIGLYNDSAADHDEQLKADRDETDAFVSDTDGWDDDEFDDDDGTHYVEKVDVNGDGDTDILEICTDGDGEAEIKATDADSADEQEMIDEHEKLDEVRDTYRNIANTLSDHRF